MHNVFRVFPIAETQADKKFWEKCKRLEWITFSHLEIIPRNRCVKMWQYAAKGK